MDKAIVKRLGNLLSVKSIVTLVLTGVFAWMAAAGTVSQNFMTVYTVVIAFYFGTQSGKDHPDGAPAGARQSGSGGERERSGGSGACGGDGDG